MSLIANGVNLKQTYNFVVQEISSRAVFEKTDIETETIHGVGNLTLDTSYKTRAFTVKGYVYGTNPTDAKNKKDALINFLSSGTIELTFPDTQRNVLVKLASEPIAIETIGAKLNASAYLVTFSFKPLKPFAYKGTEQFTESGAYMYPLKLEAPLDGEDFDFILEPYTVVNLLGSYGSFSVDSDGDGLADGVISGNGLAAYVTSRFEVNNGRQLIRVINGGTNTAGTNRSIHVVFFVSIGNVADKFFVRQYTNVQTFETVPSNVAQINYLKTEMYGGTSQINPTIQAVNPSTPTTFENISYATFTNTGLNTSLYFYPLFWFVPNNRYVPQSILEAANCILVNLSTMGELPQSLKQFFAPSGITKWEDLATSNNITAYDGTVKKGNDWLNELIPYVDSVATVGGYYNFSTKQFVTQASKLEFRRDLIDFNKTAVTQTGNYGIGVWHDDYSVEVWNDSNYGSNGHLMKFNTVPLMQGKTYKVKCDLFKIRGSSEFKLSNGQTTLAQLDSELKTFTPSNTDYNTLTIDASQVHGIISNVKLWLDGYEEPKEERIESVLLNTPLFGFNGIYDRVTKRGITKYWTTYTGTTDGTGFLVVPSSVDITKLAIFINLNNGEVRIAYPTTNTPWSLTTILVIAVLNTPVFIPLNAQISKLDIGTWYIINPKFGVSTIKGLKTYASF